MKHSLRHAYENAPFYRARFDAADVHPDALKSLADLARFPFTTKADLRASYPFGMFAVPQDRIPRLHASSGTTGKPTVVGYTKADIDTWADLVAHSIRASGGRRGDMVHVAYGYGLFTGGLGAHYGAERLGCTVVPVSGGDDGTAGHADHRFQTARHHGGTVLHAVDSGRVQPTGHRPSDRCRSAGWRNR
jgi:phenylacetate-CoA ligase